MVQLTRKEEELMAFFWEKGPLYVKEMQEFYNEPRPHINTISTMVRLLEEKGMVGHNSIGKTYQYYALISKEEFSRKTLKGIISKYFNNSSLSAVSALVQEEDIPFDELRKMIDDVEKANNK